MFLQRQIEELADICSGKFPSQTQACLNVEVPKICVEPSQPSTQDLMELCSGAFESTSKKSLLHACENVDELKSSQDVVNIKPKQFEEDMESEIKNLGCENEDRLISQLLDEEEMNKFKKKFETPLKTTQIEHENLTQRNVGRVLYDSMDEDEEDLVNKRKRKVQVVYSGK